MGTSGVAVVESLADASSAAAGVAALDGEAGESIDCDCEMTAQLLGEAMEVGDGSTSTDGGCGGRRRDVFATGSNGTEVLSGFAERNDLRGGDRPPVGGVACCCAFLVLDVGLFS